MSQRPKFYTFQLSMWTMVPLYAIADRNREDEVEFVEKNLAKGENFDPDFFKINEQASIPTLELPDGTSIKSSTEITRWAINKPINSENLSLGEPWDQLHSADIDPNRAFVFVRNEDELKAMRERPGPTSYVNGRQEKLRQIDSESNKISDEKYKNFYKRRLAENSYIFKYFGGAKSVEEIPEKDRKDWYEKGTQLWAEIAKFIWDTLPDHLPGGDKFIGEGDLQDRPGEVDFHFGAWLARIVLVSGGDQVDEKGIEALKSLRPNQELPVKVVDYWKASVRREPWQKVFGYERYKPRL